MIAKLNRYVSRRKALKLRKEDAFHRTIFALIGLFGSLYTWYLQDGRKLICNARMHRGNLYGEDKYCSHCGTNLEELRSRT